MRYPTRFQQQTLWNAATGVSILILGALLVGLIWLIGQTFGFLQPVLIPLIVAGIIAYVLDPVVRLIEKRGFGRLSAVVMVFAAILLGSIMLVATLVPGIRRAQESLSGSLSEKRNSASTTTLAGEPTPSDESSRLAAVLVRELNELAAQGGIAAWLLTETNSQGQEIRPRIDVAARNAPRSLESFTRSRAGRAIFKYKGTIYDTARNWVTAGSTRILGFLGLVLGMIMVPIYLFFFLKDSAAIRKNWHHYVPLKASRFKSELVETLQEINGYLVSFFRGQVLVAAIDGVLVGIALTIFGLPYGFMIGVFMAILGVVPYIGNILCLIPACVIAYLHAQASAPFGMGPWAYVAGVVAIFVIVQQINSLITAPKIVGDSVGLHPLTVIFSMLFWSLVLGGFVGALLAVPLTAAVKVLFRRFIWVPQLREPALVVPHPPLPGAAE